MFILPIPRSPGEHGTDDHTGGVIGRARRSFPLNVHMDVNGFIFCALLIQALSTAGVMPAEVWVAEPGYALIVCFGLVTLSACLLFSLKSLLTQPAEKRRHEAPSDTAPHQPSEPPAALAAHAHEPSAGVALLVQNSRTTQAIIEKSLANAGIQSLCVADEREAHDRLRAERIDLLIVNATAETGGRSAALRNLCEFSRRTGIPVLALAIDNSVEADLPADTMIRMPIVPHVLARAATNLIERAPLNTAIALSDATAPPQRELPKLEPEPLEARALGDLEKLGGRDFVCDIVAQFVADAAAVLASLAAAVAQRDPKSFREQAHALRSCAANVGAQNVYRMCLAWRDLDTQEIAASGAQYIQMLEQEFERVRGALTPMLQQGDGGSGPDSKAA
jgi:HPt (histidine-containing phosphotransfer) domain-containing protein/CheY-like chemotaxis protein